MSYKPHLQSLVDDLKSNPSLIHDPSFRALKALFASEFDAKFPQREEDDEKNDTKNEEEEQEREENVHIDDPDVVGPESEPVPEENTRDPNKQLTDEEANLVRFFIRYFFYSEEIFSRARFASDVSRLSINALLLLLLSSSFRSRRTFSQCVCVCVCVCRAMSFVSSQFVTLCALRN
jgi:hypothetical protein